MRKIDKVIIHCSDSDLKHHDNIDIIRQWHLDRGWVDVGYHYVITKSNGLQIGREINKTGAHVLKHNIGSIGICLTGKTFFSNEQYKTLYALCNNLISIFNLDIKDILGHYELDQNKTCPNFNMVDFRSKLNLYIQKRY